MAPSYDDSYATSRILTDSIASLSSNRQQGNSIAKVYRQAAQLFLTRRLPEAYSTIEPIITPQASEQANGSPDGKKTTPAPIASASRTSRIKVWSFYLTFLNAVIELGAEEGKHAFGSTRWKAMVAKCRDCSIWEEVVRDGYGGNEGEVDAEVVINLATLLLTHAPSQQLTQQRLETYLAVSAQPVFDVASYMEKSMHSGHRRNPSQTPNGTSTPRDLHTRLKLLELYTLHVLPRNNEWDYAREFISMSEVLDDDRKEAFLLALHGLREEQDNATAREAELREQQQQQLEERRKEAERQEEAARAEAERRRKDEEASLRQQRQQQQQRNSLDSASSDRPYRNNPPSGRQQQQQPSSSPSNQSPSAAASRPPKALRKNNPTGPPPGIYARASSLFTALHGSILSTAQSMTGNPMVLFRTLLFLFAFALAFARQDVRERLRRMLRQAWEKIRKTIGMGVKVSYI